MQEHPGLAEALLLQVIRHFPQHLAARQVLGVVQHHQGKSKEAEEHFDLLCRLDPENPENWANLGTAYAGQGKTADAIKVMEKSIAMDPKRQLFKSNLALQYRQTGDYRSAEELLKEAMQEGETPVLFDNLGSLYTEMEKYEDAKKCFEKAVKLNSKHIPAQVNLALANFFQGDWKKGFQQYEWRFFYYPNLLPYIHTYDIGKMWNGKDDLNGKRVLLFAEQGYGDMIMFARFCKRVKERGAHTILHVPPPLARFMSLVDGIDEMYTEDVNKKDHAPLPEHDYHFALMSAPHLLGVEEITGEPYVKVAGLPTDFCENMNHQCSDTFNVGIVWAGNPTNPDDRERSIPVEHFKTLEMQGVRLFSLQIGPKAEERWDGLADLSGFITDFYDTARVVLGLDLVIGCDTSVLHVAGAMGKPAWDLIRYGPDWRWPERQDKSRWYDSVRQFHQKEKGNWEEVFGRVREALVAESKA